MDTIDPHAILRIISDDAFQAITESYLDSLTAKAMAFATPPEDREKIVAKYQGVVEFRNHLAAFASEAEKEA